MKIELNNSLKDNNIFIGEYTNYYSIYDNDMCIGYSAINDNSDNMIYIYVDSKYRGNGFGTKIFKEMINLFDKDIILTIDNSNIIMYRIISHYENMILLKNSEVGIYKIRRMV